MSDRDRALQILHQVRDILAERMTERILEHADDLLDDARGDSFAGEIEALHDQIALRLIQVNQMLGNLPVELASFDTHPVDSEASPPSSTNADTTFTHLDNLPAPEVEIDSVPLSFQFAPRGPTVSFSQTFTTEQSNDAAMVAEMPTFALFVKQILAEHLDAAGQTLAPLLGLHPTRARLAAGRFAEQMHNQPEFLTRAMSLRVELANGATNSVLQLLAECFGLDGFESLMALQTLQSR